MPEEKITPKEMALELNQMKRPLQTGFECDFHDSVMKLVLDDKPLSPKQLAKLKEIYEKYLGEGDVDIDPEEEIDV